MHGFCAAQANLPVRECSDPLIAKLNDQLNGTPGFHEQTTGVKNKESSAVETMSKWLREWYAAVH